MKIARAEKGHGTSVDNRQFRDIVERFGDMVYRIALNQTRHQADAEDIVQTVFLKLYAKPPEDASPERVRPWLIRVTANECASHWRTLWKRRVSLGEVTDDMTPPPQFEEPESQQLYDALASLPEKCRIVVHLFYFEDLSTAAIADILQIREPTVRTRLARARKIMRQQLKEAWEDD